MKKAVIYARYSSSKQREESIEGQIRICEDYARKRDLDVVAVYADRAKTGTNAQRPEFQRLIADSARGLFSAVIVYKSDRFARSRYDSAIYKGALKDKGIKMHYAAENIPDGIEGILMESIIEGMAEYYSLELSQKIKRGMYESAKKGRAVGSQVPLGLKTNEDHKIIVDPETAPLVKKIYDLYAGGKTQSAIVDYLNNNGYKTKRGGKFYKSSLRKILCNHKYIGTYVGIENAIPAIIDRRTFDMVQKRLEDGYISRRKESDYPLTGKLFCGICGKPMTGSAGTSRDGTRYHYYVCKKDCEKKTVNKERLESFIVENTLKYVLQDDVVEHIAKSAANILKKEQTTNPEIKRLKKRLADTKKAADNIQKAIETGVVTKGLPKRYKELEKQISNIERDIRLNEGPKLTEEHIKFLLLRRVDPDDVDNETYRDRIISTFVSEVYLYDEKAIIVYPISKDRVHLDRSEIEFLECSSSGLVGDDECTLLEHSNIKVGYGYFALIIDLS